MFPNYESVTTVVWLSELLATDPEVPGSKSLFLGVPAFGTNTFKEICFPITKVLPLWSGGQSSWLQIQRSRVRFPALPDCLRSSGVERGPLSLVSTIEELLGRNNSGSGLENREYGRGDPLR
jgi:hypothetical protein